MPPATPRPLQGRDGLRVGDPPSAPAACRPVAGRRWCPWRDNWLTI